MLEKYNYKLIISGDVTEVYAYQDTQYKETNTDEKLSVREILEQIETDCTADTLEKLQSKKVKSEEYKRSLQAIGRTKKRLQRLIDANINQYKETDKFITLTFKDNADGSLITRDDLLNKFKRFKERMTYHYGKFEYVAVIEQGTKGTQRLHIHMVAFGLKYIKQWELQKVWKYGIVDVRKIYEIPNGIHGVADYMTKYIEKTLEGSYIERGQRFYMPSKGLKKSEEYIIETLDELAEFQEYMQNPIMDVVFNSEHVGVCSYQKYKKPVDVFEAYDFNE